MLTDEVVPQWRCIPVPTPLAARSSALFATALADEFSFELRKRRQQVQRRAAMQIRGVQGLRYRDQCYPMVLEQFHELLQVTQILGCAVLMNERRGRQTANRQGVPLFGVLGVLLQAKRIGKLECVLPALEQMQANGYRISQALVDAALMLAGETR
jgi:predicted nucleic acid-binding protein